MAKNTAAIEDFALKVSRELPSQGYGFDWMVLIEIGLSLLEGCLNKKRALASWHRRLNGRFSGFWQQRATTRLVDVATESDKTLDAQAVADAFVSSFTSLDESGLNFLSQDLED